MADEVMILRRVMTGPDLSRKQEHGEADFLQMASKKEEMDFFFSYGYYDDELGMSFDALGYSNNKKVPGIKGYEGIGRGKIYNGKAYFSFSIVHAPTYFSTAEAHVEKRFTGFVSLEKFKLNAPVRLREFNPEKDPKIFGRKNPAFPSPTVHNILGCPSMGDFKFELIERTGEVLDPRNFDGTGGRSKKMGRPSTKPETFTWNTPEVLNTLENFLRTKRKRSVVVQKRGARTLEFVKAGETELYNLRVRATKALIELQWLNDDDEWETMMKFSAPKPELYQAKVEKVAEGLKKLLAGCE